jgi:N-hydroxyarylamine O-acetyltransferase
MTEPEQLPIDLVEQVLDRLGLADLPSNDRDGLATLYRSWCRSVPFDNTLKLIALHGGGSEPLLPGMDAGGFLRSWLRHGTGGTCFPSASALHELARSCGFDSRVIIGSMWDLGTPTHGTTVVGIDGTDWLIDSSMLTEEPLPLPVDATSEITHPVFAATAEAVEEGWLLQFSTPYDLDLRVPCRTTSPEGVGHETLVERFEASRQASPFNHSPSTRLNDGTGVISYGGGKRYRRTWSEMEESELTGERLYEALVTEMGLSEEIVQRLSDALDSGTPT